MLPSVRRHIVVIALILLTAVAGVALQPRPQAPPTLPPLAAFLGGSRWHADAVYGPSGLVRQWQLHDEHGHTALLFVQAAARPQALLHWSGELGYQGAGYVVRERGQARIALPSGGTALVSGSIVQRTGARLLVESAVVSRDGIAPPHPDDPLHAAWLILRGGDKPYYLVRVSVPTGGDDASARDLAAQLLSPVLSMLQARCQPWPGCARVW